MRIDFSFPGCMAVAREPPLAAMPIPIAEPNPAKTAIPAPINAAFMLSSHYGCSDISIS
jgi:hypothetical protein